MYLEKEAIDYFRRFDVRLPVLSVHHGQNPSRIIGRNLEFEQYNPYYPGDNIRDIDWKVFARSDKLFIKNYGSDLRSRVRIILDTSESMSFAGKLEIAKKIVAVFFHILSEQSNPVFLSTVNQELSDWDRLTASRLEQTLSGISPGYKTRLSQITTDKKEITFLISDLWDENLNIHELIMKRVHMLHLLSREELDLNLSGNLRLKDMEQQDEINIVPSEIREKYKEKIDSHISRLRSEYLRSRLLYGLFPLDKRYYVYLKDFLEQTSGFANGGRA